MDKLYENSETGCCQRFNPKPWQDRQIKWKGKLFLRDRVINLFYIPLNMDKVMARDMEKIKAAGALPKEQLMLCDDGMFGSDIFIAVSRKVPGARMEKISGTFLSTVFEGSYSQVGKWIKDAQKHAESKKRKIKKLLFFYTTCTACAKAYGKNYVVILAKVG